jgi:hypothetical protein
LRENLGILVGNPDRRTGGMTPPVVEKEVLMTRKAFRVATALLLLAAAAPAAFADGANRVEDAVWGDGVIWDTVLTPTSFKQAPSHSVDLLYNFGMSGLGGQRAVSSNIPGDREYNGGRWWVQMVVFTDQGRLAHDPDGDGIVNFELTSAAEVAEHVELGHIEVYETSTYFECPLLRSK